MWHLGSTLNKKKVIIICSRTGNCAQTHRKRIENASKTHRERIEDASSPQSTQQWTHHELPASPALDKKWFQVNSAWPHQPWPSQPSYPSLHQLSDSHKENFYLTTLCANSRQTPFFVPLTCFFLPQIGISEWMTRRGKTKITPKETYGAPLHFDNCRRSTRSPLALFCPFPRGQYTNPTLFFLYMSTTCTFLHTGLLLTRQDWNWLY